FAQTLLAYSGIGDFSKGGTERWDGALSSMNVRFRNSAFHLLAFCCFHSLPSIAQDLKANQTAAIDNGAPAGGGSYSSPRLRADISNSAVTPLPGSAHPLARAEFDAGRMPGSARLNGISLYFNRSAAQQADLEALLKAQQDPHSPQFHQWFTPDQFAA